ncbi:MAG: ATP-dependent helicase HrpB [Treponema sp.]|nr:ATP-dependent helicase HrpB [Treponema sp.]
MSGTDIYHRIAATGLPLVPHIDTICDSLSRKGSVVLRADPGSGKSTLVPLALLDRFGGKIVMLEPRRTAVIGIAYRLAELLGESVGGRAGYAVRLERKVSSRTRIEVITEGLLVRRLQANPSMFDGDWTIIFDEFHERSVHTDLALVFVLDLIRMGAKIRLVIMSATMDAGRVADMISAEGDTPVIECPGRFFPVEISYNSLPRKGPLGKECAVTLSGILAAELTDAENLLSPIGDILVFLPGRREIADCACYLKGQGFDKDFDIETLHGSLPLEKQRRIIAPEKRNRRRVILSTNVAETGLTIPDITLVVDSGYARVQRFHISSGMNRLSLEQISESSAGQRAGRAGRLGPGRCIRLWAGEARPAETAPEIKRTDISSVVLECLLWGVTKIDELPWPDKPSQAAWESALELLGELGAVDTDKPTETGRQMASLGLEPRLARLCIAGRDLGKASLACAAAAILSRQDGDATDLADCLSALRNNEPNSKKAWESTTDLLRRLGHSDFAPWNARDEADIGEMMAIAFPDRIARRRDFNDTQSTTVAFDEGIFRFPSGREARCKTSAEWLCALEVDSGERTGYIRLAVPVSGETALRALEKRISVEKTVEWNGLVPRLIETKKAGRILLGEKRRPCHREELISFIPTMLREQGLSVLPWNENRRAPKRLLERIRFYVVQGTGASSWNDESLVDTASQWIGPYVWGESGATQKATHRGGIITAEALCDALASRLGWEEKRKMDKLVPDSFALPSGRKRPPIDYGSSEPIVRLRLQDAFGVSGPCTVMGAPIVFHLLSPADRPIQITSDLDGFWTGSYPEIRKEMRGRYPKHNWPENPKE